VSERAVSERSERAVSDVAHRYTGQPERPLQGSAVSSHEAPARRPDLSPGSMLALQRSAGNRATVALVVQRDIEKVEREFARRFASPEDKRIFKQHSALKAEFGLMSDADAGIVAGRLFQPVGADAMAEGMQRLNRGTRYKLLTILLARLGHLGAENLHAAVTATTADGRRLRARFAQLVPDRGKRTALLSTLTAQFAAAHQAPAGTTLWVNLNTANFRTSGAISTDNNGVAAANYSQLGFDTASGRNFMELRGDVAGHQTGITYNFKRTVEMASWSAVNDKWELRRHLPAGTNDDAHDNDEDLTPESGHLYVVDSPGPYFDNPAAGHRGATRYVYVATFVEWVEARTGTGAWQQISDDFHWHSVSALVNVNGSWQRDSQGANEIADGPIPVLSPDGQAP
jgi:hypothetical protein